MHPDPIIPAFLRHQAPAQSVAARRRAAPLAIATRIWRAAYRALSRFSAAMTPRLADRLTVDEFLRLIDLPPPRPADIAVQVQARIMQRDGGLVPQLALFSLEDDMIWQPIETAPKDGTLIVCWQTRRPNGAKVKAHHRCCVARFVTHWGWLALPGNFIKEPTHWMPLPVPPEEK